MRKQSQLSFGRGALGAAFAGLILVAASGSPSAAASAVPASRSVSAQPAAHDLTDFSAVRRRYYYRRGPNAAGLAFMGMATGLIAGVIAEQRRREYYENYYYAPGPYYGPGYGYYGGGPYYGPPRYYYPPY